MPQTGLDLGCHVLGDVDPRRITLSSQRSRVCPSPPAAERPQPRWAPVVCVAHQRGLFVLTQFPGILELLTVLGSGRACIILNCEFDCFSIPWLMGAPVHVGVGKGQKPPPNPALKGFICVS